MRPPPLVLVVASVVLSLGAFLAATMDAHAGELNCGSALLPRDVTKLGLDTGNVAVDDFSIEEASDDCNQVVLRQRYFLVLCLAGAVGTSVWAGRIRRRVDPFPGDPII